jgi:hypothetical protein
MVSCCLDVRIGVEISLVNQSQLNDRQNGKYGEN